MAVGPVIVRKGRGCGPSGHLLGESGVWVEVDYVLVWLGQCQKWTAEVEDVKSYAFYFYANCTWFHIRELSQGQISSSSSSSEMKVAELPL